jgi:2-isopropylmalate synthase
MQIHAKDIFSCFGVGEDTDIATASIKALFCALNRAFTN